MNAVLQAISDRHTCRDFSSEPLSAEVLEKLTHAALAAPSAMNLQPWHITVVTDKAFIEEMDAAAMSHIEGNAELHARMTERGGKIFYNAPCIIFIAKNESEYAALDCGIVTQNISLAAHSMGLGSCICGMARIPLQTERGAEFLTRLAFPEGFSFGMSVLVGNTKSGKTPHEIDKNKITHIG